MSAIGIEIDQDQLVLTRGRDFRWSFENLAEDGKTPVAYPAGDLFFSLDTGGEHNCVQQVEVIGADDGEYKLGYNGVKSDPIEYYKSTDTPYDLTIDIRSALENIPAIGAGNVSISSTGLNPVWHMNFTLTGVPQNEIQELSVVNLLGWLGQQLGEGQMVLSYRDTDAEAPISFESNAATIQASLESIPQIGKGNVKVTSTVAGKFNIEYQGLLASRDVDQIKVRAYEKNAGDIFGGGALGNLLTVISTKTIQNGRRSVLDGRMMDTLSQKIIEFFNLFDDKQPMTLEFVIKDNKTFTVICRSLKGYQAIDLATFDLIFSANTLKSFLGNQILLNGAINTLTVDQYWNHRYTVEFVNEAANKPHPLLVGDASGLSSSITTTPITPVVRTAYVDRGQSATTLWHFLIEGTMAHLKVESEDADRIPARTRWQLVFLPEGEEVGGEPIARGTVTEQR
ncbi:hypothetical protein SEA_DARTHPHADER_6 [Mycobacterium phage DarthPhader]|uniref:LtfC/p132/Gp6 beta-sandwich domain-containing protein n=1 Tax=Mycobacterium phage DarthPhader TaxID=1912975 RepID=A0A1I9S3V3_9CAUD|nr:minor tail protein [Mycobacterium phage DarthPhader]AOZ61247.1 hypothetical protein SEA_DARTHPHADER_6 [Mycobacterium phage DarthPhader]